jgi:hypothetical protein
MKTLDSWILLSVRKFRPDPSRASHERNRLNSQSWVLPDVAEKRTVAFPTCVRRSEALLENYNLEISKKVD